MDKDKPEERPVGSMRLNKYVAHCGVCSRREAAELVKKGKIKVNGKTEINPAVFVSNADQIEYQGKRIKTERNRIYILLNKPKDTITTLRDEHGRRTVMDIIDHTVKERIYPVGRLDRNTLGLLLLTNDGDLTKKLSHPSSNIKKVYHAVLDMPMTEEHIQLIRKGIELKDGIAEVDKIDYLQNSDKNEIGLELHSGKNRIIRRIFEKLDYSVKRLDRISYAGLTKKDLPRGKFRKLTDQEIIMLKHFT